MELTTRKSRLVEARSLGFGNSPSLFVAINTLKFNYRAVMAQSLRHLSTKVRKPNLSELKNKTGILKIPCPPPSLLLVRKLVLDFKRSKRKT